MVITFLVFYICKSEENDLKHGNYICKSEEYVPWLKRERADGLSQCCRDRAKERIADDRVTVGTLFFSGHKL